MAVFFATKLFHYEETVHEVSFCETEEASKSQAWQGTSATLIFAG